MSSGHNLGDLFPFTSIIGKERQLLWDLYSDPPVHRVRTLTAWPHLTSVISGTDRVSDGDTGAAEEGEENVRWCC